MALPCSMLVPPLPGWIVSLAVRVSRVHSNDNHRSSLSFRRCRNWWRRLGFDGNGEEKHTNWTQTRSNQHQDLTHRTQNSIQWALKLNYAKAMTWKVLGHENKYTVGLWDEGENTRTRVRCEPGITWRSDYHLMGSKVPNLSSNGDNYRFSWRMSHQSGFRSKNPNCTALAPCLTSEKGM